MNIIRTAFVATGLICSQALPGQQVGSASEPRLQQLVGRWVVVASTFAQPGDTSRATFTAVPAANGSSVYSTWMQGSGLTLYMANALWAFSSSSREVRVFETNTLGVAETHVGAFDAAGVLRLRLQDQPTGAIREQRIFSWAGDTIRMTAVFSNAGRETRHEVTMLRQRN